MALNARGIELGPPVWQDDRVHAPDGWATATTGAVFLSRLRTVDGRHVFTLKRPAENVLSCEEHETAVADRDQMHRAVSRWASARPSGSSRCGVPAASATWPCAWMSSTAWHFLEVERMVLDGVPGEAVQAELSRFVASLGIDAEQTGQTYDVLVRGLLASA